MAERAAWTVYWNEYTADTYLYGAEIEFHDRDDVEYRNHLMPPGTVIKKWYSRTSFQMQKIEPTLPMIDGERTYHLAADIDAEEDSWLLRLVYTDRYGQDVSDSIIRGREADFRCPLKAYSYRVELINAGAAWLRFHSFTIEETDTKTETKTGTEHGTEK